MNTNTLNQLQEFFAATKLQPFKRRQIILHDSTSSTNIFFIKKGHVRLYLNSEDGQELTALILKSGDVFPLNWANPTAENIYNFEAMTDVELYSAPKEKFHTFIKEHSDVLFELIAHMSFSISALIYRLQHIVFGNAQAKVASILLTSAKRFGEKNSENIVIQIPLTHQDIATAAGITRETASIEIKKLENRGLIGYKGRVLLVKDLSQLEEESYL